MTVKRRLSISDVKDIKSSVQPVDLQGDQQIIRKSNNLYGINVLTVSDVQFGCSNKCVTDNNNVTAGTLSYFICREFSENDYQGCLNSLESVRSFETLWKIKPSYLPRICGICGISSICECINDTGWTPENFNSSITLFKSTFKFLIPHSMPYMLHHSAASGLICTTPFYSVICGNVKRVPEEIFMLSKLNLGHIVNNYIYRHELAFNSRLFIKDQVLSCNSPVFSSLWENFKCEIKDLKKYPSTPSPLVFLPQILEGVNKLMHSILPFSLSSEIDYYVNTSKFLSCCKVSDGQFVENLIEFISIIMDACVIPMRKHLVEEMKQKILEEICQSSRLVNCLIMAIDLLNLTKVDQINAQIIKQSSFWQMTSTKVERKAFAFYVERGIISIGRIRQFVLSQPTIEEFELNKPFGRKLINPKIIDEFILSRLVICFAVHYMGSHGAKDVPNMFYFDTARIKALRKRFSKRVLMKIIKSSAHLLPSLRKSNNTQATDLSLMLLSPNINNSSIYRLLEKRLICEYSKEIHERLCYIFFHKKCSTRERVSEIRSSGVDNVIVKEVVTLLYLHWSSARSYYL